MIHDLFSKRLFRYYFQCLRYSLLEFCIRMFLDYGDQKKNRQNIELCGFWFQTRRQIQSNGDVGVGGTLFFSYRLTLKIDIGLYVSKSSTQKHAVRTLVYRKVHYLDPCENSRWKLADQISEETGTLTVHFLKHSISSFSGKCFKKNRKPVFWTFTHFPHRFRAESNKKQTLRVALKYFRK